MPTMAKAKKKAPRPGGARMTTRGFRMTEAYAEWIDQFAAAERMGVATLIDRAVAAYAKQVGFKAPPERVP